MHRAPSRRRPLILAVLIALTLVVGAPLMLSAAGADAGLDPLQVAIANQANCRLLLAKATSSAQQTRARQCVADQGVVITAMSATPSPSATGTPSPSPTVPPTTPPATTPPATTPPATTPPPTTTPPATTPPPSPTPTGACSTFAACGFPSSTNTGVPAGTVLTPLVTSATAGLVITTPGTIIDGADITGWLDIRAANVTIQNSRITSAYWRAIKANDPRATGIKILHNTFGSAVTPYSGVHNDFALQIADTTGDEVAFNDISGFRNGIDISVGWVHDNYVHNLRMYPGAHSQPVYGWCGTPGWLDLEHNTFISDPTNDGTNITYASGTVYIADDCQPQNERTVNDNWLVGGSLTVYGGGNNSSNIVIKNNRFSVAQFPQCGWWGYGGAFVASNPGNVWSGNTWADGVNAGKTVAAP